MAQKVQVLLVDDIDGVTADETVTFALDGVSYEIDLTTEHATELRDALAHWVANARKTSGRTAARSARRPKQWQVERRHEDPRVGPPERAQRVRARSHLRRDPFRVRSSQLTPPGQSFAFVTKPGRR